MPAITVPSKSHCADQLCTQVQQLSPPPNWSFATNRKRQKPGQGGRKCHFVVEFTCFLFANMSLNVCKHIIDHLIERLRLLGSSFSNKQSNSGGSA
jgi:hypothetical protein